MEAKNWKTEKETIIRCVLLNLAGVFIYAVGINSFAAPHKIAPGGASGIAILINYLTGCPIGLFVFVFNIPLLLIIVVKKYFPRSFVFRTLASTALLSIVTDLVIVRIPVYKGNPLLAAMFCGAMMGIGLALVHMGQSNDRGHFSSGTDHAEMQSAVSGRRLDLGIEYCGCTCLCNGIS